MCSHGSGNAVRRPVLPASRGGRSRRGRVAGACLLLCLQHVVSAASSNAALHTAATTAAGEVSRTGHGERQGRRQLAQDGSSAPSNGDATLPFPTASEYQDTVRGGRQLLMPNMVPHTWMGHIVPERERHMGMVYAGDWSRLRAALARYRSTGKLLINIVGGSISAGAGAISAHNWVEHLEDWVGVMYNGTRDHMPGHPNNGNPEVKVTNGAVPGTFSSYMSVCYSKHVPKDADIILIEYALNDEHAAAFAPSPDYVQRAFERLLRKLLSFPNKPAVILLNAYTWFQWHDEGGRRYNGMFNSGSDATYLDLAMYYQLPLLSIKACCYHLMLQGVPGFQVNRTRGDSSGRAEAKELDALMKDNMFFWDKVHPNGETGHRAMADLVIDLMQHAEKRLKRRPWTDVEAQRMAGLKLPPPMLRGNWESPADMCFIGDTLQNIVDSSSDFKWANDVPAPKKPKWGYIGNQPGQAMRVKLDTRPPAKIHDQQQVNAGPGATAMPIASAAPGGKPGDKAMTAVEVAHLKSYEGMGVAEITCISGCMCKPSRANCSIDNKVSLVSLHEVMVTQHEACVIQIQILGPGLPAGTPGSGSKIKVTGIMVSDEPGPSQLPEFAALDFVSTGMPNQTGTFDIRHTMGPERKARKQQ